MKPTLCLILIERLLEYLIMNSILIRLIIVKSNKEYNVLFDRCFSINENLILLGSIIGKDFSNCFVYDDKLNIFLDKTNSFEKYNMPSSRTLYIY